MAVPDKEWREFAKRMDDHADKMIGITSALIEYNKAVERRLEILFEKIDPALIEMAVLKDRESKRADKEKMIFGAMFVTLIGTAVTGVLTILGFKK